MKTKHRIKQIVEPKSPVENLHKNILESYSNTAVNEKESLHNNILKSYNTTVEKEQMQADLSRTNDEPEVQEEYPVKPFT